MLEHIVRVNDERVDSVTGQRKRFVSAILPALVRKSPPVAKVLPLLRLQGGPARSLPAGERPPWWTRADWKLQYRTACAMTAGAGKPKA